MGEYLQDGMAATSKSLLSPQVIQVNQDGVVYFFDGGWDNKAFGASPPVIRAICNGVVVNIAGASGVFGNSNGHPNLASFQVRKSAPSQLMAVDESTGTIYIADVSNYAVRSIKGYISKSTAPTSQPSGQPSRQPTSQPSSQPTFHANIAGVMSQVAGVRQQARTSSGCLYLTSTHHLSVCAVSAVTIPTPPTIISIIIIIFNIFINVINNKINIYSHCSFRSRRFWQGCGNTIKASVRSVYINGVTSLNNAFSHSLPRVSLSPWFPQPY